MQTKFNFQVPSMGQKHLCLSSLLTPYRKLLKLPCTNFQTIDITIHIHSTAHMPHIDIQIVAVYRMFGHHMNLVNGLFLRSLPRLLLGEL